MTFLHSIFLAVYLFYVPNHSIDDLFAYRICGAYYRGGFKTYGIEASFWGWNYYYEDVSWFYNMKRERYEQSLKESA